MLDIILSRITGRSTRLTIWLCPVHIDAMDCYILSVYFVLLSDQFLQIRKTHDMKFCITQVLRVRGERRNRQQCQHHGQCQQH